MGAASTCAGHSGDCPSSLLPHGVSLPADGTGDPTVYVSAGDGVHLPECDTKTVEGRCWLDSRCNTICALVIHGVIQTVCSAHHVQSTDNNNGHVHEQWSYLPLQDALSQRSNVTCTLPSPTMGTGQETTRNKLCTGEWNYLQLGLTTLGRVYLLVYLSLLLLQAGDVERNPGPTPGKLF